MQGGDFKMDWRKPKGLVLRQKLYILILVQLYPPVYFTGCCHSLNIHREADLKSAFGDKCFSFRKFAAVFHNDSPLAFQKDHFFCLSASFGAVLENRSLHNGANAPFLSPTTQKLPGTLGCE